MRSIKESKEYRVKLLQKFYQYIEDNEMPIIQEFCYKNDVLREQLYSYASQHQDGWSSALKKAISKKESYLERNLIANKVSVPGAIFSLKQIGWRDDPQLNVNKGDSISIEVTGKPAAQLAGLMKKRLHSQRSSNIEKRKKMLKSG
jgi:hypothetical protein